MRVRFGQETLTLDTWCRKKQYDAFRQVNCPQARLSPGSELGKSGCIDMTLFRLWVPA